MFYLSDKEIVNHEDIADEGQSVIVNKELAKKELAKTGESVRCFVIISTIPAALAVAIISRRRRTA